MLHQSNIPFKYSAPLRDLETSAINGSHLVLGVRLRQMEMVTV